MYFNFLTLYDIFTIFSPYTITRSFFSHFQYYYKANSFANYLDSRFTPRRDTFEKDHVSHIESCPTQPLPMSLPVLHTSPFRN